MIASNAKELEELLRTRRTQVIRYAMRLCVSREDVEDATQETLLALSRNIGGMREVAALSRWLFKAVRTHCTRLARRSLRRALSIEDAPLTLEGPTPEEQLVDRQLRQRLAEILAEMPEDQREAIVRCDVMGETPEIAARELGLSASAFKSRLHRAGLKRKKDYSRRFPEPRSGDEALLMHEAPRTSSQLVHAKSFDHARGKKSER